MYPLQLEIRPNSINIFWVRAFSAWKKHAFFSILAKVYLINWFTCLFVWESWKCIPHYKKSNDSPSQKYIVRWEVWRFNPGKIWLKSIKKWVIWNIAEIDVQLCNKRAYFARGKHDIRRLNSSFWQQNSFLFSTILVRLSIKACRWSILPERLI